MSARPAPPAGRAVVLHVRTVSGSGGGPEKTIRETTPRLSDARLWAAAAYLYAPGDQGFQAVRERLLAAGCPLIAVPDRGSLDLSVLRRLLTVCRRLNVRVWHGHEYKSNLLGLALRRWHPMLLVTTAHGWPKQTRRTPLYYALDRWCLPRYDRVLCVSDDLYDLMPRLGVSLERRIRFFNGIDEQRYRRQGPAHDAPLRREGGVPAERLVIGAAGRLSPEKGFDTLIEASARLLRDGLDFEVWIAGEGDERAALERLVERRGLEGRVRLLGYQADMIRFYQALDLFVLSSLREALPHVVIEALAMEVPVVATAVAGVPRLLRNGEIGLLCPAGDVAVLAAALQVALGDPPLRARLARAGRGLVEQRYRLDARVALERSIYDRLLGLADPASLAGAAG